MKNVNFDELFIYKFVRSCLLRSKYTIILIFGAVATTGRVRYVAPGCELYDFCSGCHYLKQLYSYS